MQVNVNLLALPGLKLSDPRSIVRSPREVLGQISNTRLETPHGVDTVHRSTHFETEH
jgi:hypothetical protein